MKVVVSSAAEADLEEIADFIAKHNPRRALTFIREWRAAAFRLRHMPRAAPLVPRYEHHAIRRHPVGHHLIFYRVDRDQVSVIHILHGARDYEALLFPDDR